MDGSELDADLSRDSDLLALLEGSVGELDLPAGVEEKLRNTLLRSEDGKYRVRGRVRRTDLREPPTLGACWRRKDAIVFARGDDRNAFHTRTLDGGHTWKRWERVPQGAFSSGLSAAVSPDGRHFQLFGRGICGLGRDRRIWRAHTAQRDKNWDALWVPIKDSEFRSAPGIATSADGLGLVVVVRGRRHIYFLTSHDAGASWEQGEWTRIVAGGDDLPGGEDMQRHGYFISAPAVCASPDLGDIHVFGVFNDLRVYHARKRDRGATWSGWHEVGGDALLKPVFF